MLTFLFLSALVIAAVTFGGIVFFPLLAIGLVIWLVFWLVALPLRLVFAILSLPFRVLRRMA
jgi:hypothetical protein